MKEAGAALDRLIEPKRPSTESEEIVKQLSAIALESQGIEKRLSEALSRLNYDDPPCQDQKACAEGIETSPPFSGQVDRQLMALRTTLSHLHRHISRLERFV